MEFGGTSLNNSLSGNTPELPAYLPSLEYSESLLWSEKAVVWSPVKGDANGAPGPPPFKPGRAACRPELPKNLSARRPSSCSGGRGPSRVPGRVGNCNEGSEGSWCKSMLGSSGVVGSSFKR
jgi:hypothetical protein